MRAKKLGDQVVVITGASSGIGLATAKAAAKRGVRLVLNSRDEADLQAVVREIEAAGGTAVSEVGDVADGAAMVRVAERALREFGALDTWINNAGVSIYGAIQEVPVEDARRLFETNYWGVVNGTLAALPFLKRTGGTLINVGSVLSETGYPLQGHYSASKHAVKGFTDSLRLELMKEGAPVTVTLIQPGAIDTPYTEHARNYLDVEPKHQPPVYAPEIVADAILACAERPHRNLRVGGSAKVFTVVEKVAPGLADRQKMSSFEQQRTDEPARDDDTLFAPRSGDARVRGRHPGRVRERSAYTSLARRPIAAALGLAALGIGLGLAAQRLRMS